MIITRTPFRISFFGGGTDYPEWYLKEGGSVLSTTIDKYGYISCRYLPPFFNHCFRIAYSVIENVKHPEEIKHPAVRAILLNEQEYLCPSLNRLEIHYDGDLPARAGLGTSSSFTAGLLKTLAALKGEFISKIDLAYKTIDMEQNIIKEHVGSQDQVAASYGGLNRIDFTTKNEIHVHPVTISASRVKELEDHLILCFTNVQRIASDIAKTKIDNLKKRYRELKIMHQMVSEAIDILCSSNTPIEEFGKLLHENWQYKRTLSDKVSNESIDNTYEVARKAGAIGGKILGAGGGGFLLLFAKPEDQPLIKEALKEFVHVPFKLDYTGSQVIFYQPNNLSK